MFAAQFIDSVLNDGRPKCGRHCTGEVTLYTGVNQDTLVPFVAGLVLKDDRILHIQ